MKHVVAKEAASASWGGDDAVTKCRQHSGVIIRTTTEIQPPNAR
jgi:hypothetical protein